MHDQTSTVAHGAYSADLAPYIARLAPVDEEQVHLLAREATSLPGDWIAEYGEYQSGNWWTTSLMNESGDPGDVTIRDCDPVPTSALRHMHHTHRFLENLGLRYMSVRLARLDANGFLWEHTDYADLRLVGRRRLHIPLATNPSAYMVIDDYKIRLRQGWIWRLDPTMRHGACNLYGPGRIHLIIDCYTGESLDILSHGAALSPADVTPLPACGTHDLERHAAAARRLMRLGYQEIAEKYLLRLFYRYSLPPGHAYDMIAAQYRDSGALAEGDAWESRKAVLLGARS
jgi:hypothetical protein